MEGNYELLVIALGLWIAAPAIAALLNDLGRPDDEDS